jgi:hypothetical protein
MVFFMVTVMRTSNLAWKKKICSDVTARQLKNLTFWVFQ